MKRVFVMGGTGATARKIHTMRGGKGTLAKGPQGTTNSVALQNNGLHHISF